MMPSDSSSMATFMKSDLQNLSQKLEPYESVTITDLKTNELLHSKIKELESLLFEQKRQVNDKDTKIQILEIERETVEKEMLEQIEEKENIIDAL